MVRLSDLIGKNPPEKEARPPAPPAATPAPPAPAAAAPSAPAAPPQAAPLAPAPPPASPLEAYYAKLAICVKELLVSARAGQPLQLAEASMLIEQLPKLAPGQYDDVLMLDARYPDEPYLVSHSVRVAFLVHRLAHLLGYPTVTAHQLALAGLVFDIGMAGELEQITQAPRTLTKDERKAVSRHSASAAAMLQQSQELSKEALAAIAAHHVRPDGTGYPGVKEVPSATAMEYAKILAVADVYDAMTHARSHRRAFNPGQAIKQLIDGVGEQFDRKVIKALVDELSLYPRGSTIRLNTNEVAVVLRVSRNAPLRPMVEVHRDAYRNPVVPPKLVNLAEHPLIYIKDLVVIDEAQAQG